MITEKDIIDAYTKIRTIDNTIPDEVLDFIKNASIKQLRIGVVSSSYAVQKLHFYSMISTYLKASEEVENGIYDPIEDALQEIQQKYLIIQKA